MPLNFPLENPQSDFSQSKEKQNPDYEFSKAIDLFTSQRKKCEISIEQLSNKTKISRNVLLGIEAGLKQYLPEKTYLISMIKRLETELNLEEGSLNGILAHKAKTKNLSKLKFKFINIDFLNSWMGSFLYFILMLISILALNSQHKYLLKINSLSTEPIYLNEDINDKKNDINMK